MQRGLDGTSIVDIACERIRTFAPADGYWLAFSGGKDSVVLKWLAQRAGVKFEAHYSNTTCDPPELYYFIRDVHPDVSRDRPAETMWQGIRRRGYPTRVVRWCCAELKERGGMGRTVLTGIRWAESPRRKAKHGIITQWTRGRKTLVNPMIDWRDEDVWACIRENRIPYCCLYDEGWKRLGCVLCPMSTHTAREAARWPGIASSWRRAFHALYKASPTHPKQSVRDLHHHWSSADALFEAWMDRRASLVGDKSECVQFSGGGMFADASGRDGVRWAERSGLYRGEGPARTGHGGRA